MVTNRWREKQGSDGTRCQQVPAFWQEGRTPHWLGTSYVETLKKCNIKASGIIQKLDYICLIEVESKQFREAERTSEVLRNWTSILRKDNLPIITHATDAVLLCRCVAVWDFFNTQVSTARQEGLLWPAHASVRGQLYRTLAKIRTGRLIYAHPRPQIEVYTSPSNSLLSLLYFILIHSMKTTTMLY